MRLDALLNAKGQEVFLAPPKSMRAWLVEHWNVVNKLCDVRIYESGIILPVERYVGAFTDDEWKAYFARPLPVQMPHLDPENLGDLPVVR